MDYQMLIIDLSNRTSQAEEIPLEVINRFIGGRGLGAYLLYEYVPAKAYPLGKENCLIFTAGPASGTSLFYSSKANVNTKSPLTGIYLYSISSGIMTRQMRKAGYWAITIKGMADSPTYLVINKYHSRFRNRVYVCPFV